MGGNRTRTICRLCSIGPPPPAVNEDRTKFVAPAKHAVTVMLASFNAGPVQAEVDVLARTARATRSQGESQGRAQEERGGRAGRREPLTSPGAPAGTCRPKPIGFRPPERFGELCIPSEARCGGSILHNGIKAVVFDGTP